LNTVLKMDSMGMFMEVHKKFNDNLNEDGKGLET
jgi:hypothetical protein